jgi:hypothetical protein
VCSIYPLRPQPLTGAPPQRTHGNSFGINTFRTLFITTEGWGGIAGAFLMQNFNYPSIHLKSKPLLSIRPVQGSMVILSGAATNFSLPANPLPTNHSLLSPVPEPRSSRCAADADSASQCSDKCCRTASQCKSPALRCPRCPPDPFRPCGFPAETL